MLAVPRYRLPLRASALCQNSFLTHSKAEETGLCNHDPIVDAEPRWWTCKDEASVKKHFE
jgi:hypothetical protein